MAGMAQSAEGVLCCKHPEKQVSTMAIAVIFRNGGRIIWGALIMM